LRNHFVQHHLYANQNKGRQIGAAWSFTDIFSQKTEEPTDQPQAAASSSSTSTTMFEPRPKAKPAPASPPYFEPRPKVAPKSNASGSRGNLGLQRNVEQRSSQLHIFGRKVISA